MAGPIAFLAPDPVQSCQLIPGSNTPASGAQLFVYQVGTSTKTNSYTDPSASTARTNPIVLDSGGNVPGNGEVWITSTAKFVLAPSNDTDPPTSPYWTRDNYRGINDITAAQVQALSSQSEWVQGSTATFVGATLFSLVGDQTSLYTLGRRVKAAVTGGDRFAIVTSSVLSGGSTSVGITLDSGTLNGGLNSVQYGILSTPNGSVPWTTVSTTGNVFQGTTVVQNLSAPILIGPMSGTSSIVTVSSVIASVVSSNAGSVNVSSGLTIVAATKIGTNPATAGLVGVPYSSSFVSRNSTNNGDVYLLACDTKNSVSNSIFIGTNTSGTNNAGGVRIAGVILARPPTVSDLSSGEYALWRDTAASTVRFYFNVAGTIVSSAAFL